jgi:hypothetical protein
MTSTAMKKVSAMGLAVALTVTGMGCSDDDEAVVTDGGDRATTTVAGEDASSVAELLAERPTSVTLVQGGVFAMGFEYFGEDEMGWEWDVTLCQSVTVEQAGREERVRCEGESVALAEGAEALELGWQFPDVSTQYAGDVVLRGTLEGDVFEVAEVVDPGGEVEASIPPTTEGPVDTTDPDDAPLPMDELPGEDLRGLRRHLRTDGTVVIYLAQDDFVSRVRQLRANCETQERLQEILDNLSSRGPEAPQDYLIQHTYVCPDLTAQLDLPDGVVLPG